MGLFNVLAVEVINEDGDTELADADYAFDCAEPNVKSENEPGDQTHKSEDVSSDTVVMAPGCLEAERT